MLISELTFPHLLAEREAQLTRELEQQRVLRERLEEEAAIERAAEPAGRHRRSRVRRGRGFAHARPLRGA
jgi:hypothetical protein